MGGAMMESVQQDERRASPHALGMAILSCGAIPGNGLGQAAKMVMVVETRQRLGAAIRACCEAMAHAPWPVVSTRSRVMACPAAWIWLTPASAHAGSSVLWG